MHPSATYEMTILDIYQIIIEDNCQILMTIRLTLKKGQAILNRFYFLPIYSEAAIPNAGNV